jgi:hypothetical protein
LHLMFFHIPAAQPFMLKFQRLIPTCFL